MHAQNAMLINGRKRPFNFHSVQLISSSLNLSYSIHFELRPLSASLAYLLIYQFDEQPPLTEFHGFRYLCRAGQRKCTAINAHLRLCLDLDREGIYTHFLDNTQTPNHHSIVYGIRELTRAESDQFCVTQAQDAPSSFDNQPAEFTSNYEIRYYQSGCFYLDSNNNWQSDGLTVRTDEDHPLPKTRLE